MKNKRHLLILGLLCCVQSSDAMYGNPKNIAAVFLTTLLASTYGMNGFNNSGDAFLSIPNILNASNQPDLYGNKTSPQFLFPNSTTLSSFGLAERSIDIPTTSFPQSFSNISMPHEIFYQPTLTKAQLKEIEDDIENKDDIALITDPFYGSTLTEDQLKDQLKEIEYDIASIEEAIAAIADPDYKENSDMQYKIYNTFLRTRDLYLDEENPGIWQYKINPKYQDQVKAWNKGGDHIISYIKDHYPSKLKELNGQKAWLRVHLQELADQSEIELQKQFLPQFEDDLEKIDEEQIREYYLIDDIKADEFYNAMTKYEADKERAKEIKKLSLEKAFNKMDEALNVIDKEYNGASAPLKEKIKKLKKPGKGGRAENSAVDSGNESLAQLEAQLKEMTEKRDKGYDEHKAVYSTEHDTALKTYKQDEKSARAQGMSSLRLAKEKADLEFAKIKEEYNKKSDPMSNKIKRLQGSSSGTTIEKKVPNEEYLGNYIRYIKGLPPEKEARVSTKAEMNRVLKDAEALLSNPIAVKSLLDFKDKGEIFLQMERGLAQYIRKSNNDIKKMGKKPLFNDPDADISKLMRMPHKEQKLNIGAIGKMIGDESAKTLNLMHTAYLSVKKDFNAARTDVLKKIHEHTHEHKPLQKVDEHKSWNPLAGSLTYIRDKMGGSYGVAGVGAGALSTLALAKYAQSSTKQELRSKKDETRDMGQIEIGKLIHTVIGDLYKRIKATEGMENFKYSQETFTAAFSRLDSAEDNGFDAMFSSALDTIRTDQDPEKGDVEDKIKATVVQDAEKVLERIKIYQGSFDMDKLDDRNVDTAGLSDEDHTMLTQYHKLIDQDIMLAHADKLMLKKIVAMAMDDMPHLNDNNDKAMLSLFKALGERALKATSSQARSRGILRGVTL